MKSKDFSILHVDSAFFAFLFRSAINALVLQPAGSLNSPHISLLVPQPLSTGAATLQVVASAQNNATYNSTNNLLSHTQRSDCNAAMYGVPTISSCLDVYRQMTDNDKTSEFGDRTRGVFEYPLPYRLTSGQ